MLGRSPHNPQPRLFRKFWTRISTDSDCRVHGYIHRTYRTNPTGTFIDRRHGTGYREINVRIDYEFTSTDVDEKELLVFNNFSVIQTERAYAPCRLKASADRLDRFLEIDRPTSFSNIEPA